MLTILPPKITISPSQKDSLTNVKEKGIWLRLMSVIGAMMDQQLETSNLWPVAVTRL